jgi:hypothetical protein
MIMSYWVFNEEQLGKAIADYTSDHGDSALMTAATINDFLHSVPAHRHTLIHKDEPCTTTEAESHAG